MAFGLADLEITESAFVTLADDEPGSYKEAMSSVNAKYWEPSCHVEYDTLMGYHTWTLVKRPPNTNIVGNRWIFHIKRDNLGSVNKFKLRLVAQGFSQIAGLDYNETYSPTIRFTTIQLILALACKYDLELQHIDIKGAYLNGKLEDDVYMRQPESFVVKGKEHMVCKLNKGVYGLKQSGRVWHQTLKKGLEALGFTAGHADSTVFFRFGEGNSIELAGWYVDDGLLAADSLQSMEHMVHDIGGSFDIQDLGNLERLLGIRILRNPNAGTIHISQPAFINTIAKHFNILAGRPVLSPMDSTIKFLKAPADADTLDIPYASLIGSINYCLVATRPDIAFATRRGHSYTSGLGKRPELG
jgi:Reverse transcriptase (RNA-dependent DNA polymerase)